MNEDAKHDYQRNNDHARRMTEIALRGTALLWDLQANAARNLLETQASTAVLFGAPDFRQLFHMGNGRGPGMFTSTMDQALQSLRQINDTVMEVQWQLGRVAEQQTEGLAEQIRQGVEQLGQRSEEGLQEIRRLAEQEANEVEQSAREARSRAGSGDRASAKHREGAANQAHREAA